MRTKHATWLSLFGALVVAIALPGVAAAQFGRGGPSVKVEAVTETDGGHPGTSLRVAVGVTIEQGWHVNAHKPLDEDLIPTVLDIEPPEGVRVAATVYPEPVTIASGFSPEPLAVYGGTFDIGVVLELAPDLQPGEYALKGALKYQACDDKRCFPPNSRFFGLRFPVRPPGEELKKQHAERFKRIAWATAGLGRRPEVQPEEPSVEPAPEGDWRKEVEAFEVVGVTSGYQGRKAFLSFLAGAEGRASGLGGSVFAGKSLWLVVVLVLVGGLLLNLTPCVLPLIPINLGIIGAGAQAGSRGRGFALGGLYGAAIALVYGILGLVVILGVAGTFGALNATPAFNAIIALVFVVLGLAMFDVIVIDFTRFQGMLGLQQRKKRRGPFFLAFFMGGVSALLAGACVAPVIISTIVYAQDLYAKGTRAALLLPFLLGVGMALPWPFAGAGLSFLPKPGAWMVRVKHVFGVLIFAFAAYYGYLAVTLFSERFPAGTEPTTIETAGESLWTASLSGGLVKGQAEGKPVVIDFWATWCKNCTTMDKTTFKHPDVTAALERFVPVKYQAENPNDPATREVLEHFGILGLPTYVILKPRPPA